MLFLRFDLAICFLFYHYFFCYKSENYQMKKCANCGYLSNRRASNESFIKSTHQLGFGQTEKP